MSPAKHCIHNLAKTGLGLLLATFLIAAKPPQNGEVLWSLETKG